MSLLFFFFALLLTALFLACWFRPLNIFFVAGSYALSVLDDDVNREKTVKHYRIRDLDNGGCYISPKQKFNSMAELIQYYSGSISYS